MLIAFICLVAFNRSVVFFALVYYLYFFYYSLHISCFIHFSIN